MKNINFSDKKEKKTINARKLISSLFDFFCYKKTFSYKQLRKRKTFLDKYCKFLCLCNEQKLFALENTIVSTILRSPHNFKTLFRRQFFFFNYFALTAIFALRCINKLFSLYMISLSYLFLNNSVFST